MTMPLSKEHPAEFAELEAAAAHLGTDNQRERFAAGLLPEDELLALARGELYRPFDGLPRWGKYTLVRVADIRHTPKCEGHDKDVVFESCQAGELSHDEWVAYRALQAARDIAALHPWLSSPGAITLEPMGHFATCTACDAEVCRMSAKVIVKWAGRELVREYVLR